jgi:hypothetical protein
MVCSAQRFGEQALGSRCIAFSREQEVDRRPDGVTARYKYTHLPLTRTYISSTRQLSLVGLSFERKRRSISGAYRCTHRRTVT